MPKSGEQDEKTAPSEAAASIVITASGRLGSHAATRSPGPTPSSASAAARAATSRAQVAAAALPRWPVSSWLMIAGSSPAQPVEQVLGHVEVGVGEEAGGRHVVGRGRPRSTPRWPTTPHWSQTAAQNSDGCSTDQRCSCGVAGLADVVQEAGEVGGLGPGRVGPPEAATPRHRPLHASTVGRSTGRGGAHRPRWPRRSRCGAGRPVPPHQPRRVTVSPSCRNVRVVPSARASGSAPRQVSSIRLPRSVVVGPLTVPEPNRSPGRGRGPVDGDVGELLGEGPVHVGEGRCALDRARR